MTLQNHLELMYFLSLLAGNAGMVRGQHKFRLLGHALACGFPHEDIFLLLPEEFSALLTIHHGAYRAIMGDVYDMYLSNCTSEEFQVTFALCFQRAVKIRPKH